MKKYVVNTKKSCRYKVSARAYIEMSFEEEYEVDADDEEDAIDKVELRAMDDVMEAIEEPDVECSIISKEIVETQEYGYEFEKGEVKLVSAGLPDYEFVGHLKYALLNWDSYLGTDYEYYYAKNSEGELGLFEKGGVVRNRKPDEVKILPIVILKLSKSFKQTDDKIKLGDTKEIIVAGTKFYYVGGTRKHKELGYFSPAEAIGKCVVQNGSIEIDNVKYEDSEVKKIIDEWAERVFV